MKTEVVLKFLGLVDNSEERSSFNENRSCIEIKIAVRRFHKAQGLMKTEVVLKWKIGLSLGGGQAV